MPTIGTTINKMQTLKMFGWNPIKKLARIPRRESKSILQTMLWWCRPRSKIKVAKKRFRVSAEEQNILNWKAFWVETKLNEEGFLDDFPDIVIFFRSNKSPIFDCRKFLFVKPKAPLDSAFAASLFWPFSGAQVQYHPLYHYFRCIS